MLSLKPISNYLPWFTFEVVKVDAQGIVNSCYIKQAQFLPEDLGNGVILEMVKIPGGTFLMGSPETEEGREDDESPQHEVTVQPFFIGKYPVTQAQWKAVAALTKVNRDLEAERSYFKGDNLPVEEIYWDEAVEFCARLSRKTGRHYRLPSEAEWEYACRAGTTTPFHFGETITADLANYDGNRSYGSEPKGKYREQTTAVGHFQVANAFGLYDMHGNVWEWCADSWHNNYEGAPTDGNAWFDGSGWLDHDILRGGSWTDFSEDCRCACRRVLDPVEFDTFLLGRDNSLGFRVVCEAAWTL